jgi:hypothetical protein
LVFDRLFVVAEAPKEGHRPSFGAIVSRIDEEKALIKLSFLYLVEAGKLIENSNL